MTRPPPLPGAAPPALPPPPPSPRWRMFWLFVLLAGIGVGGWLRWQHVYRLAPVTPDEAHLLEEARKVHGMLGATAKVLSRWHPAHAPGAPAVTLAPQEKRALAAAAAVGHELVQPRPVAAAAVAATGAGGAMVPQAANVAAAVAGAVTLALTGLVGFLWLSPAAAASAVWLLAFSALHLHDSRRAGDDVHALAFLLIALALLAGRLRHAIPPWRALSGGLAYGLAVACEPAVLWLAPLLVAAVWIERDAGEPETTPELLVLVGLAGAFALVEGAYHLALMAGALSGVPLVERTYALVLTEQLAHMASDGLPLPDRVRIARLLLDYEAAIVLGLAGLGTLALFGRRRGVVMAVGALWFALVAFAFASPLQARVHVVLLAPFVALVAGTGADMLGAILGRERPLAGLLILLLIVVAIAPAALREFPVRDRSVTKALAWMKQHRLLPRRSAEMRPVTDTAALRDIAERPGKELADLTAWDYLPTAAGAVVRFDPRWRDGAELRRAHQRGARFLLVDHTRRTAEHPMWSHPLLEELRRRGSLDPAARALPFDTDLTATAPQVYEDAGAPCRTANCCLQGKFVELYDLAAVVRTVEAAPPAPSPRPVLPPPPPPPSPPPPAAVPDAPPAVPAPIEVLPIEVPPTPSPEASPKPGPKPSPKARPKPRPR